MRLPVIDIQKFLRVSLSREFSPVIHFTNFTVYISVSNLWEFFFNVESRVQFTGERLSYFPLIESFSHTKNPNKSDYTDSEFYSEIF